MPDLLAAHIRYEGLPEPEREFRFHARRKWRFDFAWPELKIACEYEGLFSRKSGHTTISGYTADLEKYNAAALDGWAVYRFMAHNVRDGTAIQTLRAAILNAEQ